jgi:hypothetical protein
VSRRQRGAAGDVPFTRFRKSAATRARPDPDDRIVANAIARSEAPGGGKRSRDRGSRTLGIGRKHERCVRRRRRIRRCWIHAIAAATETQPMCLQVVRNSNISKR